MEQAVRGRRLPRRAVLAALTGAALVGTMVPGAQAITGNSKLVRGSQPTIGTGQTNAPAGDWTLTPNTPTNTWAAGETVVITVDDSVAGGNCTPGTNFVSFSSLPTVTVSSGTVTATRALSSTPGACTLASKQDVLTITFGPLAGTGVLTISNVKFDVGSTTALGPVTVTATDSVGTVDVTMASNAFVTDAKLTANTPPLGVKVSSGIQAISNFTVAEQAVDTLSPINNASGRFCVQLQGGAMFDTTGPAPAVAVAPAGDTATVTVNAGSGLDVVVTDSVADLTPTTFTLSNLRLNAATTAVAGLKTALLTRGSCAAPGVVLSSMTTVAAVVNTARLDGADRFLTAQKLFESATTCAGNGLTDVIIARADDFPDALAASYLAGKLMTGILLVDKDSNTLPPATVNALKNRGVDKVTIVGGVAAVPATLANALGTQPNFNCAGVQQGTSTIAVERIDGADRYETARKVAEKPGLAAAGTADYDGTIADPDGAACVPQRTAILATGENFPDALVAGPVAYNGHNVPGAGSAVPPGTPGCGDGEGFPVILTNSASLNAQAASALTSLGIQQVLVMGGNTAIAPAVVTSVQAINSITTRRFAGTNRLDTAKQFAEFAIDFLGYDTTAVAVARGDTFPDALAGAPFAGIPMANVIVLTESPSAAGTETLAFFADRQGVSGVYGVPTPLVPITGLDVFGGPVAVPESVISAILAAISQA